MGYYYSCNESRTMKWMHEEFEQKQKKYLGKGGAVKKMARMDKVRLKEELNFKNQVNPLVKIFGRINKKIENKMLSTALQAILR